MREPLQQPKFRYTNEIVGLFVLGTMLVFVAAMLYSGQVRKWLKPGETLKVVLPEAGLFGLTAGSKVEILGTVAGEVTDIVIDPNRICMPMCASIKKWCPLFVVTPGLRYAKHLG